MFTGEKNLLKRQTKWSRNRPTLAAKHRLKLIPVILPIDASAVSSCTAADRLAKVSGILVPNAIIVIPVTLISKLRTQPSNFAN